MDLVQSRIVTDDVVRLAAFYAGLARVSVVQRQEPGQDRLREQQQPDHRRAARGPLDVQDQGGRRHRVAERADGLGGQQPGQPGRPPYQRVRH